MSRRPSSQASVCDDSTLAVRYGAARRLAKNCRSRPARENPGARGCGWLDLRNAWNYANSVLDIKDDHAYLTNSTKNGIHPLHFIGGTQRRLRWAAFKRQR